MNWYLQALRKYADFEGRARRTEYWMFSLVNFFVSCALVMVDLTIGTSYTAGLGLLLALYALLIFVPSLAVSIRRLHDTGRSGWWLLISIVPLVGAIAVFVFHVQDSAPGSNEYGPNPKLVGA